MSENEPLVYFPSLKAGLTRPTAGHLQRLMIVTWHLMMSGRTLVEDAEGAVDTPEYLLLLKLRLAEVIVGIDLLLRGVEMPDEAHRLAIAAELGLSEVVSLAPDQFWSLMCCDRNEDAGAELAQMSAFWDAILCGFPATLPNPLVGGPGQRDLIQTLRAWSQILDTCGIDGRFLVELYKSL